MYEAYQKLNTYTKNELSVIFEIGALQFKKYTTYYAKIIKKCLNRTT